MTLGAWIFEAIRKTPDLLMQRRILYLFILAIGFVWVMVSADQSGTSTTGKIPAPQEGFLAPDFELETPTGETIQLSELRGQAVLVNLWATWCPPCREEMQTIAMALITSEFLQREKRKA
jgi:thiol-disulfide isomerase/thioredoxin